MAEDELRALAMPPTGPGHPPRPCPFADRERPFAACRTDMNAQRAATPAPLGADEPPARFELVHMPVSTGFGDCPESGQLIPAPPGARRGGQARAMHLGDQGPIAGGREMRGFPRKLARPRARVEKDRPDLGSPRIADATMGGKQRPFDPDKARGAIKAPAFPPKIVPHLDRSARICELACHACDEVTAKGAREGPFRLEPFHHARAPAADQPVRGAVAAFRILADPTRGPGMLVHDDLRATQ